MAKGFLLLLSKIEQQQQKKWIVKDLDCHASVNMVEGGSLN